MLQSSLWPHLISHTPRSIPEERSKLCSRGYGSVSDVNAWPVEYTLKDSMGPKASAIFLIVCQRWTRPQMRLHEHISNQDRAYTHLCIKLEVREKYALMAKSWSQVRGRAMLVTARGIAIVPSFASEGDNWIPGSNTIE